MALSKQLQNFRAAGQFNGELRKKHNEHRPPSGKRERIGKTLADKANGHIAGVKNRRLWDRTDRVWYKVA